MRFVITEYNITGCWYGRRPVDTPVDSHVLKTILQGFCSWVNGVAHMSHTKVSGVTAPFTVHVRDCASHGNDFMVVLWLSSSRQGDDIYAISADDPPNGMQQINVQHVPDGSIAGFPAFFFVDSDHNRLLTFRHEKIRTNGRPQFDAAMRDYMSLHSNELQRSRSVDDEGENVVTIEMCGADGELLNPKFESEVRERQAEKADILRRANEIRKIIRVQDISKKPIDEKKSAVRRLFSLIGASIEHEDVSDARKIRCEIDVHLTREDVENIIRQQSDSPGDERYAFEFKGDSKKVWADKCIARRSVDIDLSSTGPQDLTARAFLDAIEARRDSIV